MIKNKVLLTGVIVTILFSLMQILAGPLGIDGLGLDLSWLADGEITVFDIISFIGAILISVSKPVRENILAFLPKSKPAEG